jgi:predicted metal-binding membrane protein
VISGDAALIAVLKRDRLIVGMALALLAALAWAYLLRLNGTMTTLQPGMANTDMSGMAGSAMPMNMPGPGAWDSAHIGFLFVMWATMMVAMMTPAVAPMVLIYTRVGRQARVQGTPFAPAAWFAGGYLLAWVGFALLAALAQYELARALALSPAMRVVDRFAAGSVLVLAGLYQWTPVKDVCLAHCTAPLSFIQRHGGFQPAAAGSFRLGLRHGLFCIGCCWLLMALLFVGGVMNMAWIVVLVAVVIAEKLVPAGRYFSRGLGLAAIFAGIWVVLR